MVLAAERRVRTSDDGGMAERLVLVAPRPNDVPELLDLVRGSRLLHRPWVYPPRTPLGWARYLQRSRRSEIIGHLLKRCDTGELVGVVNISEVVRGAFSSAYLGFYAHAKHARQGFMREGLRAVVARAFKGLRLHRLEANIQPANTASKALIKSLGFKREGFSKHYLKVGGRWRDHERWALTKEVWREQLRKRRTTTR
jgi:ribosomal-protein-alanine N-acetyltransferase